MLTGAYSSLFIAAPLVGWLKSRSHQFARRHSDNAAHLVGEELRTVVIRGTASARAPAPRRRSTAAAPATAAAPPTAAAASTTQVLSHPPRPRKKKRR
jgi:hypothetical protein